MASDSKNDPVRTALAGVSQITAPTTSVPPSPSPEWESEPILLKDFSKKRPVPCFAKIVKGNYMTLGSSKFSFSRQHYEVFIHSVKVSIKILAHCLRKVENLPQPKPKRSTGPRVTYSSSRLYSVDQRLAIPVSYLGWFELLSEDGKSARPIASVLELSKVRPDKVLVRENIKGYSQREDGKMTFDSTKIVLAGEQLVLCEDVSLPSPVENKKVKLLRCFDSKGEQVYLSFDQKGLFTPIAGDNDIAGVFTIRDVMRRFRLPLTVKLVQGVRPKVDPSRFTGVIRLDWAYSDETVFVCPIEKNHIRLLPVPIDTNLQLVAAGNQAAMKSTQIYNNMRLKCNRMISNYNNTIHLIVTLPDAAAKGKNKPNASMMSGPIIAVAEPRRPTSTRARAKQDRLLDEIDDLYGYVRDGGPPPISSKMEYDSDEASYFEEPAYEPLDDFRARLIALEAGEKVEYHSKYKPQDISKLALEIDPERIDDENPYGVINGGRIKPFRADSLIPPPLPARPSMDLSRTPSSGSLANSHTSPSPKGTAGHRDSGQPREESPEIPPPLPERRHLQQPPERFITTVSANGVISFNRGSQQGQVAGSPGAMGQPVLQSARPNGRLSMGSLNSLDSVGSSGKRENRLLGRDFRDSDISAMTRQSSGSSSGGKKPSARKKLQTLYL